MKHFDVEDYAKELLVGYTLKPNESTWPKLLDKLSEAEQKNRKQRYYIKGATFLVILMLGIGFTNEGIEDQVSTPFIDTQINLIGDEPEVLHPAQKREVRTKKSGLLIKATTEKKVSIKERRVVVETKKKAFIGSDTSTENIYVEKNIGATNTSSESWNLEVTEAEIDDLMRKARQNVERQRALLRMRKVLAIKMLAEIEEEIEHQQHRNGISQSLKYGFVKLKDAIAN
eukprot:TRINITY_DN106208_c0_g1_i3.p1 TRINITY_DN106208_c0_g1~~TRINITY_DN106208_c0_g1_i3.p1  ORF type:complete len:229 (-),score=23.38 TRINITY_DN106208_c0_g1_i3:31-717(-)